MSEIARQIKAIVDLGLAPMLKQAGFRKRGAHWTRVKGEALQIINIQSSQFNMGSQGKFTLNVGVHFSSVAKMLQGTDPMPADPKEYYCLLRRRIGMLRPATKNDWWTITPQTNIADVAAELTSECKELVLPWLGKVETVAGAAAEIEEHPNALLGSMWTAAAARLVLGESDKAADLVRSLLKDLSAQLETCHPANAARLTDSIEKLNQWALDHNVPGFVKT